MRHISELLIGGLAAIIALILYEQSQKPATAAVVGATTGMPAPAVTIPPPAPATAPTTMNAAASTLPQFSASVNPTVIDMDATPSFNGRNWTCPNGDLPYYDPSSDTVYCVLPGLNPNPSIPDVTGDLIGGVN